MEGPTHPRERGQSMVEVALCLPILCILLVATAQFGVMIWRDMELTSATRDGARRASVSRNESAPSTAVRETVHSSLDTLSSNDVTVTVTGGWNQYDTVTVTATTPYALDILGFKVWNGNLRSSSEVRIG